MDACEFSLDAVAEYLEGTGVRRDEMTEPCCFCGESCSQQMNICAGCGVPTVWKYSRVWRRLYGDPDRYLLRLQGKLNPVTPLQVEMAKMFGREMQFRTVTQQKEAKSIERLRPDDFIREMMVWAETKGWSALVSTCKKDEVYQKWLKKNMESMEGIPGDEIY